MDEPTNDLDSETLDLLEELLLEYKGTVLLVSHDRAFLNNVATSTVVFENGGLNEYIGGYDDWLRQRPKDPAPASENRPRQGRQKKERQAKIGFNVEKELKELPGRIEALEAEQLGLHEAMAAADFYVQGRDKAGQAKVRLSDLERELKESYKRWEELEAHKAAAT